MKFASEIFMCFLCGSHLDSIKLIKSYKINTFKLTNWINYNPLQILLSLIEFLVLVEVCQQQLKKLLQVINFKSTS